MSVFITVLSGVFVFVFGQIILKLIIDPIHQLKKTISEIANSLIMDADIYFNVEVIPLEEAERVRKIMRSLSSKLQSDMYLIPFYKFTAKMFGLPSISSICEASRNLIGISNVMLTKNSEWGWKNADKAQIIRDALNIYTPDNERITIYKT